MPEGLTRGQSFVLDEAYDHTYDLTMSANRITITIDEETYEQLREQVPPGQTSAFVVEALRAKLQRDPIVELLDYLDNKFGPLTDEDKSEGQEWYDEVAASMPQPTD